MKLEHMVGFEGPLPSQYKTARASVVVVVERRSDFWASCIIYLSVAESSAPPLRRLQEAKRGCEAQFGGSSMSS